jgi:signal recognition particle subunit SRP54
MQRFDQAAKMMKTVAKGGMPNIPGMGPVPGSHGVGKRQAQQKPSKGKRSGNPAKRAQAPIEAPATGGVFGGAQQAAPDLADMSAEDRAALQRMLGGGR